MSLSNNTDGRNVGTLFKNVKYYVVGNIPQSVSSAISNEV